MNRSQVAVGGGVLLGLLALLLLALLVVGDTTSAPVEPAPAPRPAKPKPAERPMPASVRIPLPPPRNVEPPTPPDERPPPAPITPDDRRDMNFAVDRVLQAAREECLEPWLAGVDDAPPKAEFVFDAVLFDGQLADIGMRSLHLEVPRDVVGCVADRAWYADWPTWDLQGELRLQRSFEIDRR